MVTWNPADYAKNSTAQLKWAKELMARLHLERDMSVLDVGCGDGKITAEIAKIVAGDVLGIDTSREMLDFARQAFPRERFPNLDFQLMPAQSIRCATSFDRVFSNAALHWVDDQPAFLRGAFNCLKPGGQLIISCGGKGNVREIIKVLDDMVGGTPWSEYIQGMKNPYYFHGTDDYEPWLRAAGFKIVRLALAPKDMCYPNRDGLVAWVRTTWLPFTARIPESLQPRFIDEVVDRYLRLHPAAADGAIRVTAVRLEVEAVRESAG